MTYHQNRDPEVATELFEESQKELEEEKRKQDEVQQRLREWILNQKYLSLEPEFDGMTAWELAGMILKVINNK